MTELEKRDYNARMAVLGAAKHLIELGHNVISVNLYGSQNYDCDTPNSDFDFKAVIVPTIDDIVFNRKPLSTDIEFEGGLIDIKDIRLMFDNYKKQNVNFIETLFTRWFWAAPEYFQEWHKLRAMANRIAFADPAKSINCMIGMAKEKEHALCQPYPSKVAIIEKYGFDPKQLMHILRLALLMEEFMHHFTAAPNENAFQNYGDMLVPDVYNKNIFINIKKMITPLTIEGAKEKAVETIVTMEQMRDAFKEKCPQWGKIDEQAYADFDELRSVIIKKAFVNELSR